VKFHDAKKHSSPGLNQHDFAQKPTWKQAVFEASIKPVERMERPTYLAHRWKCDLKIPLKKPTQKRSKSG
jgi:hypothetical protein